MHRHAPRAATPVHVAAVAACSFVLASLAALTACGGGGASAPIDAGAGSPVELFPLEIQPLGAPLAPIGLLEERRLEWRANQPGEYRVALQVAGDDASERVLATGLAGAYETVGVTLRGVELGLAGPSPITFSLVDQVGRSIALTQELELEALDVLSLGAGEFTDLAFDAAREELVVADASAGELRVIDVDEGGAGYGSTVATLSAFAPPGPLRVALGADGRFGYALSAEALHEFDRDTLELLDELALPGAADPSGLRTTPDASSVYLSHPGTLLIHRVDEAEDEGLLESTGIADPDAQRGELAVTPDGARLLYAWEGPAMRGLWSIGSDPQAPDFHEVLVDHRYEGSTGASKLSLAIAESGRAVYTLGLDGLAKFDLEQVGLPLVAGRSDLSAQHVMTATVADQEFVLALEDGGALSVLDAELALIGGVELSAGNPDPTVLQRSALDRERGRLFVLRTTVAGTGELIVLPLE